MIFKANQENLISHHPSLEYTQLSNIVEGEEGSDDNEWDDIDEGHIEEPKRKEWKKLNKSLSNYTSKPPSTQFEKHVSEEVKLKEDSSLLDNVNLELSNKSENGNESEEEDVFDMLIDTPSNENDDNLK